LDSTRALIDGLLANCDRKIMPDIRIDLPQLAECGAPKCRIKGCSADRRVVYTGGLVNRPVVGWSLELRCPEHGLQRTLIDKFLKGDELDWIGSLPVAATHLIKEAVANAGAACNSKDPLPAPGTINISVRDCDRDRLVSWVKSAIGELPNVEVQGEKTICTLNVGQVTISPLPHAKQWLDVWFNSTVSPWSTDTECARQAAKDLACAVRCDPLRQYQGVHPQSDEILEIGPDGVETLMLWV
jgi:hypothetical protein